MSLYKDVTSMIEDLKYERPSNYMGPDYFGYIVVYSRTRDSHLLDQYNFKAIEKHLKTKITELNLENNNEDEPLILNIRDGHWAVGWIEFLYVKADCKELMAECFKILNDLDSYPVFDDCEFSEFENEAVNKLAEQYKKSNYQELLRFLDCSERKLPKKETYYFCQIGWESQASYCGADDCYFDAENSEHLEYLVRYIKENQLSEYYKKVLKLVENKLGA